MENCLLEEKNIQTDNPDIISKKSVGSSIRIDSISIDLVNNYQTDASQCEHFSIRGYVSEIRKKNWKICWPFAADDDNRKSEQICSLPPLHVPKFRRWSCQNCLKDVTAVGIPENHGPVCSSSIFKSSGTCSHVSPVTDATVLRMDLQRATELNIREGRNDFASIADSGLNNNDDGKGEKSESSNSPVTAPAIASEDNINLEIPVSSGVQRGSINSVVVARDDIDKIVAHKSNCNGAIEIRKPSRESHKNSEVANQDLECMVEKSIEICQTGKHPSAEETRPKLQAVGETAEIAEMVDAVNPAVKDITCEHPSPVLDDSGNASSESGEILAGTALQHPDDNLSGSHRRKTPKMRLLTDLLAENGDMGTNLPRTENMPSNSVTNATQGAALQSGHQGLVSVQGKVDMNLDWNRKRKFLHDEESRPLETSSPNNVYKEYGNFNEGVETTHGLESSDSEEDAGMGFQIGRGSNLNKFKFDRNSIKGKKKNKRNPVVEDFLSLAPFEENVPKVFQNKAENPNNFNAADNNFYNFAHTTFLRRGMYPFPLPPQKTEARSTLLKKKNKMPRFDVEQASRIPWSNGMLKECPLARKDVEIMQANITAPFQSVQDASAEKGLHLSFNSRLSAQSYDKKYISQQEGSSMSWLGGTVQENQMGKGVQRNYFGDSNYPSNSEPDAYRQKEVNLDLGINSYTTSFLNEKPKSRSQVQQRDYFGTSNTGEYVEIQDHLASARKHSNQRGDKLPEQGVPDDIPMEIVELMAKNQYERCLPDVENDKRPLETTANTYNTQIHVKGRSGFLSEEVVHRPKPRSKNSGKIKIAENLETTKHKSVDPFFNTERRHLNFSQLEQTYVPEGLRAFPHCHEKSLSGVKLSAGGSSKDGSSQNSKWFASMPGYRSSQSNLQSVGACNTYPTVSQESKEVSSPRSSMMSNHAPFLHNFSQKHVVPSNNKTVPSHCPSSMRKGNLNLNHDLNFSNIPASNLEKHPSNLDLGNLGRQHTEYPFACRQSGVGSLDLYSNETIPAMHLLSLMEGGMRSGAAADGDCSRKFLNRPPFAHEHHLKEISGLPSRGYNTINDMRNLSHNYHGKSHHSEKSRESFPAVPKACASGFPFQSDNHFEGSNTFTKEAPLKSLEKRKKAKGSDSLTSKGLKSPKSVFTGIIGSGSDFVTVPVHSSQKFFPGTSDFKASPLHFHEPGSASKAKFGACKTTDTIRPPRSIPTTELCCLNRNPADFTAPGPGNPYMIRGEDLKFNKPVFSEKRTRQIKLDGHKRHKKATAAKAGKL